MMVRRHSRTRSADYVVLCEWALDDLRKQPPRVEAAPVGGLLVLSALLLRVPLPK
jgi:hypothetical protein